MRISSNSEGCVLSPPRCPPDVGGAAHARVQRPGRGAAERERHLVLHGPPLLLDLLLPLLSLLQHGLLPLSVGVFDRPPPLGDLVQFVLLPEPRLLQVAAAFVLLLLAEFLSSEGLERRKKYNSS